MIFRSNVTSRSLISASLGEGRSYSKFEKIFSYAGCETSIIYLHMYFEKKMSASADDENFYRKRETVTAKHFTITNVLKHVDIVKTIHFQERYKGKL